VLAVPRLVPTREKCCESGSASRFGDYPQGLPQSQLSTLDLVVGHEDYVVHMPLYDGVNESPNPTWCEGIRGDTASRRIDRSSSFQRHRKRWRGFRFDANHPDLTAKPSRNAGDKPTAANGDEEGFDIRTLLLDLQPDGSLAQQCFALVVGVDGERS
jgi:hypothetical protein